MLLGRSVESQISGLKFAEWRTYRTIQFLEMPFFELRQVEGIEPRRAGFTIDDLGADDGIGW